MKNKPRPRLHMHTNPNDTVRGIENRKRDYLLTYPSRVIKFFAGFFLFIPITMIAFGVHCFQVNEWPWSNKI